MYKVNLKIFRYVAQKYLLWRVPWATLFYAFQHHKMGRNETLFDTLLFKLIKKLGKIVV